MMDVLVPTGPASTLGTPPVFFEGPKVDNVSGADDRVLVD